MKRLIMILIIIFPIFVFGMEYQDSSINLTINVDNYLVFTRNNIKDNANLKEFGITEEYMQDNMSKNSIYFDIVPDDFSHEILIIIPEEKDMINNLSNVPESFLNELGEKLAKEVGLDKSEVYKNKYTYLVREYSDNIKGYNIINYCTIVNGRGYNFQLQKKDEITQEEKDTLKKIIDSADIKILDEYKDESEDVMKAMTGDKKGFDWKKVITRTIIGGVIGGIGGLILGFINKKIKH